MPIASGRACAAGGRAASIPGRIKLMAHALGIHHITAIASHAQENLAFYAGLLGLRLVKRTVNFDDPATHHLYYGDETGSPGSIVTFFPWQGLRRGRVAGGQVTIVRYEAPPDSLDWWQQRLDARGVTVVRAGSGPDTRLTFQDNDGLPLEIVIGPDAGAGWGGGTVGAARALRRFGAAVLASQNVAATTDVLTGVLGFRDKGGGRFAPEHGPAAVELRTAEGAHGLQGAGTVHHIAFRVADQDVQLELRDRATALGLTATEVMDRQYFRSVYFREPGGILFELATDGPGFATDEAPEQLGTQLRLPPWLRSHRAEIEAALDPLDPAAIAAASPGGAP